MKQKFVFRIVAMLTFAALFYECTDKYARYEDPPWFKGTNIETLEKAGNCTQFLALMDKADYRTAIESQMFTLFVPNDSSFEEYYKKIGISSIDDMTRQQAEELFGQFMLINPRSRDQLMYEYAWNELQTPEGEYGTLFNRKQTYSVPINYSEEVRYNPDFVGQTLSIYRSNTFISLFTTEYFEDYFGDPNGSDYLFMYPGSKWTGTQWNDAAVTSIAPTSSGYIYYIDRVVAPIPTIDKYLKDHQDKFGLYYDLAQRFAQYTASRLDEQKNREYRKSYTELMNFGDERGPSTTDPANMIYLYTAFIPYDNVLQDYLNNTVFKYYESIDSVPQLFLIYLLKSHQVDYLTLPSKMDKRFTNYYGDDIEFHSNTDIGTSIMCSNGVIYAMNKVLEPNAFTCVPGPIYYNSNYTTFLYALNNSGVLPTLTQPDVDVTLFATDNSKLLKNGIRTKNSSGDISIEIQSSDGLWNSMVPNNADGYTLEEFVKDNVFIGKVDDLSGEGYLRMASDNYVHYKAGKIYGGGNQKDGDYCQVVEKIPSDKNGVLYYLDGPIKNAENAAELILSDPDLSSFKDLLTTAGLIDSVQEIYEQPGIKFPRIRFMPDLRQWTILAPDNQAIASANASGLIPADTAELRNFIYYHFVRSKCVFDDGEFSGSLPTQLQDTVVGTDIRYKNLTFTNSVNSLSVTDNAGNTVSIDHSGADYLVQTGVLHKINSVLISEP